MPFVLKAKSFVLEHESFMTEAKPFMLGHEAFMPEAKPFLLGHEPFMLEAKSFVLEHESFVREAKSFLLTQKWQKQRLLGQWLRHFSLKNGIFRQKTAFFTPDQPILTLPHPENRLLGQHHPFNRRQQGRVKR